MIQYTQIDSISNRRDGLTVAFSSFPAMEVARGFGSAITFKRLFPHPYRIEF